MISKEQFQKELDIIIQNGIREDIGPGDYSSLACIPNSAKGKAKLLVKDTGIVIISLGETRTLAFRNIKNHSENFEFQLLSGSLIFMSQKTQEIWQHSIPKSKTENDRMSLTFRKIK